MLRFVLAAMSLLLLCTPPLAAEECGWLPTADVDAALPAVAPWSVMVGGPGGSCKFLSTSGPPNVFGANQMVKASPAEAASFVRGLRPEMAKSYTVAPAKDLGAEAFTYRPKDGALSERSIYFVAHEGRIAVIASLSLQKPVGPEDIAGATKLVRAALAIDKDAAALAAVTACPWFDTAVLEKLLPGEGFSSQRFGNNSCMAQAAGSVLTVTIVEAQDPTAIRRAGGGGQCKSEPVAALGPGGEVAWACEGGAPRATVSYVSGGRLIAYSFAPEREPTAAERALLVELATSAPARTN